MQYASPCVPALSHGNPVRKPHYKHTTPYHELWFMKFIVIIIIIQCSYNYNIRSSQAVSHYTSSYYKPFIHVVYLRCAQQSLRPLHTVQYYARVTPMRKKHSFTTFVKRFNFYLVFDLFWCRYAAMKGLWWFHLPFTVAGVIHGATMGPRFSPATWRNRCGCPCYRGSPRSSRHIPVIANAIHKTLQNTYTQRVWWLIKCGWDFLGNDHFYYRGLFCVRKCDCSVAI